MLSRCMESDIEDDDDEGSGGEEPYDEDSDDEELNTALTDGIERDKLSLQIIIGILSSEE